MKGLLNWVRLGITVHTDFISFSYAHFLCIRKWAECVHIDFACVGVMTSPRLGAGHFFFGGYLTARRIGWGGGGKGLLFKVPRRAVAGEAVARREQQWRGGPRGHEGATQ